MSAYFAANGHRVTGINLLVPWYGTPVCDVTIADAVRLTNPVALTAANLTLAMAVALDAAGAERQRSFAGSATARLVGGFGGWQRAVNVPPLGPVPTGIRRSVALRDLCAATGATQATRERFVLAKSIDTSIGSFWVPPRGATAASLLALLAGPLWWVDAAGTTQIAATRPTFAVTTPASVEMIAGAQGWATVATEDLRGWLPGARYVGPTVPEGFTVNAMRAHSGPDGVLRVEVLTS